MKKHTVFDYDKIKDRYIQMTKAQGEFVAISNMHNELTKLETHVYDGGFDRDKLEHLQEMRRICRELWTSKYKI